MVKLNNFIASVARAAKPIMTRIGDVAWTAKTKLMNWNHNRTRIMPKVRAGINSMTAKYRTMKTNYNNYRYQQRNNARFNQLAKGSFINHDKSGVPFR